MEHMRINEIFPERVLDKIEKWLENNDDFRARDLADQVITPNLRSIEKYSGKEWDANYLAYAIEYALMVSQSWEY